jgi:hypothetical protein
MRNMYQCQEDTKAQMFSNPIHQERRLYRYVRLDSNKRCAFSGRVFIGLFTGHGEPSTTGER